MSDSPGRGTFAESIRAAIDHRLAELAALDRALAHAPARGAAEGEWSAREILLHVVGAMSEIPDRVRIAVAEDRPFVVPSQRGGAYTEIASVTTAREAATLLQQRFVAIADALAGLSDDALRRPIRMAAGDGEPSFELPVGQLVRYSVTVHVDEHLAQLRDALTPVGEGSRP